MGPTSGYGRVKSTVCRIRATSTCTGRYATGVYCINRPSVLAHNHRDMSGVSKAKGVCKLDHWRRNQDKPTMDTHISTFSALWTRQLSTELKKGRWDSTEAKTKEGVKFTTEVKKIIQCVGTLLSGQRLNFGSLIFAKKERDSSS